MRIKGVTSYLNPDKDNRVETIDFMGSSVQSINKQVDNFFSLQPQIVQYSTECTILSTKVQR